MAIVGRRRLLPTLAAAAAASLCTAGVGVYGIEWGETTSSTSDDVYSAAVGELMTVVIQPGLRASIDFVGDPSNHFAVSYRQCSLDDPQPLQLQYSEKLNYLPFVGGCIYAQNTLSLLGEEGCTFWQYKPDETYSKSGIVYEDEELLEPGRVRLENQGNADATVEVVMFSEEVPVPSAVASQSIWIEDTFIKEGSLINTTVNVYFNDDSNYCGSFGCTVNGYVNDYVEGQDSLSLCQVQEGGVLFYEDEPFDYYIPLSFDLPESDDFYVTLVLVAKESPNPASNYTTMASYGLDQVVVFQTDTTQEDSGAARVLAGLSLMSLSWLILFNTLMASLGATSAGTQAAATRETMVPATGW
ncbi:unnamed protein product [Ectocarpus fasciculatus]